MEASFIVRFVAFIDLLWNDFVATAFFAVTFLESLALEVLLSAAFLLSLTFFCCMFEDLALVVLTLDATSSSLTLLANLFP